MFFSNANADTELLFIRHGEKPELGLGQLNCHGLNRSLALPKVLMARFGSIDMIIAPNPSHQKTDHGKSFSYVRPLATIEPTAIQYGLPVDTSTAFDDVGSLASFVEQASANKNAQRILIAWEHHYAQQAVKKIAEAHGLTLDIPIWSDDDFDSIYILDLKATGNASFRIEKEGLDNLSSECP